MSNLGTFNARKLKLGTLLRPNPSAVLVASGSCPGVGLGVKMYDRSDFTLTFISVFLLEVIAWVSFMLGR